MLAMDGVGVIGGWFVELPDVPVPAMVKNRQTEMIGRRRRKICFNRWMVSEDADGIE